MTAHAMRKNTQSFEVSQEKEDSEMRSGSFYRASHFGWALMPMWVGVTYLFLKDMGRISEVTVSSVAVNPLPYTPFDSSMVGHVLMLTMFFVGVGFGLWIIKAISKVEKENL